MLVISFSLKKIKANSKAPKFRVNVRISKYKNIFSKGYTENQSREKCILNAALKPNSWTMKSKI